MTGFSVIDPGDRQTGLVMRIVKHRIAVIHHRLSIAAVLLLLIPSAAASQDWRVDLLDISEQIEARYYMAEHGTLPPQYILLGGISIYPGFLQAEFDFRKTYTEYDPITGLIYRYRVPGEYKFAAPDRVEDGYYISPARQVDLPGIEVDATTFDYRAAEVRRRGVKRVWIEDIKYNLEKERSDRRGGGLIDFNIPIKLPKQIEWLIGDGEQTRLTVSGSEKITIGGTSKWCANCPVTEGRPTQQKFPDLDMEQQLNVNLTGNIGEKIHVNIMHSSMGGAMGATNKVRLNYQGFEDEIIKSIDMGDTDLTLSGAQLISYSGAAKGLFGVKVQAQIGLMDLTVIASKEEGESSSGSFSGSGAQSSEFTVHDFGYIKRQYFYFETPGASHATPIPGFITSTVKYFPFYGGIDKDDIEVFRSLDAAEIQNRKEVAKYLVDAVVDSDNDGDLDEEEDRIPAQWYEFLRENDDFGQGDYSLIQYIDNTGGTMTTRYIGIRLNQPLPETKTLAIRYKTQQIDNGGNAVGDPITVGDYKNYPPAGEVESVTLLAELICPTKQFQNDTELIDIKDEQGNVIGQGYKEFYSTWHMMMRNVYSLGSSSIGGGNIEVEIKDVSRIIGTPQIQQGTGLSYLRIFGLDQENTEGERIPDNRIDMLKGVVNTYYGYIMFPSPEPFRISTDESQITNFWLPRFLETDDEDFDDLPLNELVAVVYDSLRNMLNNDIYTDYIKAEDPNKFDIVISSSSGSRTFQLNAFDIIEGSEVVTVDGERLSRGTDYSIDYSNGTVTLIGDAANISPDASVSIDYQHTPLIGGGKSSLLGVGANFNLSTKARINASFLYNAQGNPRYNPRLGDEPTRVMAADVNGSFQFYPRWMTSMVNLLPRVDTDTQSSLSLSGEVAVSIPNPNTKGEAFIDDMEGIEDADQLTLIRRIWYPASAPIDPVTGASFLDPLEVPEFYWYNPVRNEQSPQFKLTTSKKDLNPALDDRENASMSSLFIKSIDAQPGQWCGVMTGFPGGLDLRTAQYLEIWVNDYNTDPDSRGGILHIEFGDIDEDFHNPGVDELDDEKQVDWIKENDDFGFDGDNLSDVYPKSFSIDGGYWNPEKRIYNGINSRVDNTYHDSEDLNNNMILDERNNYYAMTLDLADTALIDIKEDFGEYTSYWNNQDKSTYPINQYKSWRMYRLDISKAKLPTGVSPRLDAIQHMRIWVENPHELEGVAEEDGSIEQMVEITGMKFVGSRWEYNNIRDLENEDRIVSTPDMKVKIGTINNKDNPSLYVSPVNINEEEGISVREQSLLIEVENFERERSLRMMKRFLGMGQDYQQYREIQFWVRGDENLTRHEGDQVDFYMQIAYDSLNYYEIAVPLTYERAGKWSWVNVLLSDLTNMKLDADAEGIVESVIRDTVDPDRTYEVKLRGNPQLFRVRYLFAGLRNRTGVMIPYGQVWFNDLALGNVRKDIDHAERFNFSANFAGIFSLGGNWQRTGPEFRSLNQKKGSGLITDSYAISGKTDINHFIPTAGFTLPVTVRYNQSNSKPKYLPQKDVEITDPAVQDSLRSVKNSVSMSLSISRRGSKNFLMKNIFDNLKGGVNYSKNASFSPTAKDTIRTFSANASYQIQFNRKRTLSLFKGIKWRYWLTNFSMKAGGSRKTSKGYSLSGNEFVERVTSPSSGWNNEISTTYEPFESVKLNYRRNEDRNLILKNDFNGMNIGTLTSFRQNVEMNYQPKGRVFLISQFNPRFEYRSGYEEDLRPGVRQGDDPEGTRDAFNNREISVVFDVNIGKYAIGFGKKIGLLAADEAASAGKLAGQRAAHADRKARFEQMMADRMTTGPDDDKPEGDIRLAPEEETPQQPPPESGTQPEQTTRQGEFADLGLRKPRQQFGGEEKPGEAPSDSMAVDTMAVDSTAARAYDPVLLVKHLLRLIGRTDPIKSTFSIDRRTSYERMYERADLAYQLGFSKNSGVFSALGDEPVRGSRRVSLDLRSGLDITSNLSATINFNISKREDEADTRVTESDNMTWPDVSVKWTGLERMRFLNRFMKSSDLTVSYIQKTSHRLGEETKGYQLNPNWNLNWKNGLVSNVSVAFSKKTVIERNQERWDKSWSLNLNFKYDFTGSQGFGLPIPFLSKKKIKFQSKLTSVVDIIYSKTEKWNVPPTTMLAVSPRFTYNFSNNVTGSLQMSYKRSAGGIYGYVNHEIGLHATADFKF